MCINAPESTTNSFSSDSIVDGEGRHQVSEESPLFLDFFGQPPRCFTGTPLLPFRLFLRPILKFWVRWGCVDEDHLGKSFQAMDFGLEC